MRKPSHLLGIRLSEEEHNRLLLLAAQLNLRPTTCAKALILLQLREPLESTSKQVSSEENQMDKQVLHELRQIKGNFRNLALEILHTVAGFSTQQTRDWAKKYLV